MVILVWLLIIVLIFLVGSQDKYFLIDEKQ